MSTRLPSEPNHSETFLGHPTGLFVLFFAEMWERFSYYGMRAILTLYMITAVAGENPGLGWDEAAALSVYGWYTMLVYVMAIPGGFIADRFIGQKRAVMVGGFILVAGHGILAVDALWAFFLGLGFIVVGVGFLKPNISTMVGALYPDKDPRRDQGFTIFYIGINIGAFLSALVVGYVGEVYGWHYGFGLAGIGMAIGQIVFISGRQLLKGIGDPPAGFTLETTNKQALESDSFLQMMRTNQRVVILVILLAASSVWLAFRYQSGVEQYAWSVLGIFLAITFGWLTGIYRSLNPNEKDRFALLLLSFLIVIVFWGAYEQAGGLLNIYTLQKINRVVAISWLDVVAIIATLLLIGKGTADTLKKRSGRYISIPAGIMVPLIYGLFRLKHPEPLFEIPASVFQSLTALYIILIGSSVGSFWVWWQKKGRESSSIFKMAIGTIIMGTGFLFMARASAEIQEYGDKAALWFLLFAYLLHVIGELCASPVALSFITKVAPAKYVSVMMGVYFAATGFGSKLAGFIGEQSRTDPIAIVMEAPLGTSKSEVATELMLQGEMTVVGDSLSLLVANENLWPQVRIHPQELSELMQRVNSLPDEPSLTAIMSLQRSESTDALFVGTLDIFELQERKEYRTFLSIFIFSALFGGILLLFLKKLKRLAHGADAPEE